MLVFDDLWFNVACGATMALVLLACVVYTAIQLADPSVEWVGDGLLRARLKTVSQRGRVKP